MDAVAMKQNQKNPLFLCFHKLKSFFIWQMLILFEDDALAYIKAGMPIGHRNILQNQLLIVTLWILVYPLAIVLTSFLFWVAFNINFALDSILAVWAYLSTLGIIHYALVRRERDWQI